MRTLWFKKKGDLNPNSEASLDVEDAITIDKLKELLLKEKVVYLGENVAKSDIDIQLDEKSDPLPPRQKLCNISISEEDILLVSVRNASIVYIKDEKQLKKEKMEDAKNPRTTQIKSSSSTIEVIDLCDSDNEQSHLTLTSNNNNNNSQTQQYTPLYNTQPLMFPLDLNEDPDAQENDESIRLLRNIVPPHIPESQLRILFGASNKDINAVIRAIEKHEDSSGSSSDSSSGSSSGSNSGEASDSARYEPTAPSPSELPSIPVAVEASSKDIVKSEPEVSSVEQSIPSPVAMEDVYTYDEEPSERRTQSAAEIPTSAPAPHVPVKTTPKGQESIGQQARLLQDQRVGTIYRYQPFEKKYWLMVDSPNSSSDNSSDEESEDGSLVCVDADEIEIIPETLKAASTSHVEAIQDTSDEEQSEEASRPAEETTQMLVDSDIEIIENAGSIEGYKFIGNFPRWIRVSNIKLSTNSSKKRLKKDAKVIFELNEGTNTFVVANKETERKFKRIIATMKGVEVLQFTPGRPQDHYHIVGRLKGHSVDYLFPLLKEKIIKVRGVIPKQQHVRNGEQAAVIMKVYLKDQPEPAPDSVSKFRLTLQKLLDKMKRMHTPGAHDSEDEKVMDKLKEKKKNKKYTKIAEDLKDFIANDEEEIEDDDEEEERSDENGQQEKEQQAEEEENSKTKKKQSSKKKVPQKTSNNKEKEKPVEDKNNEEDDDKDEGKEKQQDDEEPNEEQEIQEDIQEQEKHDSDEDENVVDLVAQEERRQMYAAEIVGGVHRVSMRQLQRMESSEDSDYYDNLVRQFVALSTPLVAQPLEVDTRSVDAENKDTIAKFMENDIQEQDIEKLYSATNSDAIDTTPNPVGLNLTLRPYQQQALTWMKHREVAHIGIRPIDIKYTMYHFQEPEDPRTGKKEFPSKVYFDVKSGHVTTTAPHAKPLPLGGLLADEMGKTIEMISLILDTIRKCDARPEGMGGTLIVVPSSVLDQWYNELAKHVTKDYLSVYLYQGAGRNRKPKKLAKYDVVITNYPTLANEWRQQEEGVKKRKRNEYEAEVSDEEERVRRSAAKVKKIPSPILNMPWFRVVLDEAHTINTITSGTFAACHQLQTERHWGMTGTPIQNKVDDLFAFFKFLRVPIFGEKSTWDKIISLPFLNRDNKALIRLHDLLHPLMLRRSKQQEINGSRLLTLPPKTIEVVRLEFSQDEQDVYDSLFQESSTKFNTYIERGTVLANYQRVVALLLRLRQACDHPYIAINSIAKSLEKKREKEEKERREQQAYFDYIQAMLIKPDPDAEIDTLLHHSVAAAMHEPTLTKKDIYTQYVSSAKIEALMNHLKRIQKQDQKIGEFTKCVAFSQWTEMLDIVEYTLKQKNIKYQRLDGKVSVAKGRRDKVLNHFKNKSDCRILLVSLKTGGLGLQLSAANVVFLLDPWWNPAIEMQAIDRVHRIGQTKPVFVYKFIMKNTVEEPLLKLQEGKKALLQGLQKTRQQTKEYKLEELKQLFDRPEFKLSRRNLDQQEDEPTDNSNNSDEEDENDEDDDEESDNNNNAISRSKRPHKRKAQTNLEEGAKRTRTLDNIDEPPELVDDEEDEELIRDEPSSEVDDNDNDEEEQQEEQQEEEQEEEVEEVEQEEEEWWPKSKKETDFQYCLERAITNAFKKDGKPSLADLWNDIEEKLVELGKKKNYAFTWALCAKTVPHNLFIKWLRNIIDHPSKDKFIAYIRKQLYPEEASALQEAPRQQNVTKKKPISGRLSNSHSL